MNMSVERKEESEVVKVESRSAVLNLSGSTVEFRPKLISSTPRRESVGQHSKSQTSSGVSGPGEKANGHIKIQRMEGNPPPAPGLAIPSTQEMDSFLQQYGKPIKVTRLECGTPAKRRAPELRHDEPVLASGTDITVLLSTSSEKRKGKKKKRCKRLLSAKTRNERAAANKNVSYSGGELERVLEMAKQQKKRAKSRGELRTKNGKGPDEGLRSRHASLPSQSDAESHVKDQRTSVTKIIAEMVQDLPEPVTMVSGLATGISVLNRATCDFQNVTAPPEEEAVSISASPALFPNTPLPDALEGTETAPISVPSDGEGFFGHSPLRAATDDETGIESAQRVSSVNEIVQESKAIQTFLTGPDGAPNPEELSTQATQTDPLGISIGIQTGPAQSHTANRNSDKVEKAEPRRYQARLRSAHVEGVLDNLTVGIQPELITEERTMIYVDVLDRFSSLIGLVPPSLIVAYESDPDSEGTAKASDITSYRLSEQGVQIFLVGEHYIVAHQSNEQWYIYDSVTDPMRPARALNHLKRAFLGFNQRKAYWLPSQQQLPGSNDCGLLTAANAFQLAFGRNPCAYRYNTDELRKWLREITETGTLTEPPYLQGPTLRKLELDSTTSCPKTSELPQPDPIELVVKPKPAAAPPVCKPPPSRTAAAEPKPAPAHAAIRKKAKVSKPVVGTTRTDDVPPPVPEVKKMSTQERMAISHPAGYGLFGVGGGKYKPKPQKTKDGPTPNPRCVQGIKPPTYVVTSRKDGRPADLMVRGSADTGDSKKKRKVHFSGDTKAGDGWHQVTSKGKKPKVPSSAGVKSVGTSPPKGDASHPDRETSKPAKGTPWVQFCTVQNNIWGSHLDQALAIVECSSGAVRSLGWGRTKTCMILQPTCQLGFDFLTGPTSTANGLPLFVAPRVAPQQRSYGVLKRVPLQVDMSTILKHKYICNAERFKGIKRDKRGDAIREKGKVARDFTLSVLVTFCGPRPSSVLIPHLGRVHVDEYRRDPKRCYNCQQVGKHSAKKCKQAGPKCPRCGHSHQLKECMVKVARCAWCDGAHSTGSFYCPERKRMVNHQEGVWNGTPAGSWSSNTEASEWRSHSETSDLPDSKSDRTTDPPVNPEDGSGAIDVGRLLDDLGPYIDELSQLLKLARSRK